MKQPSFKDVLPEYPSTVHLPWKPNNRGDKIVREGFEQGCLLGDEIKRNKLKGKE